MEESTDSEFTISYDEILRSPEQDSLEEGVMVDVDTDTSEDSTSPGRSNDEGEVSGRKAMRLSPRQRHRRQSLARFKKKQWGEEWLV